MLMWPLENIEYELHHPFIVLGYRVLVLILALLIVARIKASGKNKRTGP